MENYNLYSRFFTPFPTLYTERLILRKLKKSDDKDLFEYCKSERSARYSAWTPHQTVFETRSFIKYSLRSAHLGEYMIWGIELKSTGELIGTCSFTHMDDFFKTAEIGYGIREKFYGKGYGSEAVKAVIDYGFCTIGLIRLSAKVMTENEPSKKLLERNGFKNEGILKNGIFTKGKAHDLYVYALTDDDYAKAKE